MIWVTGASSGIGRETALALDREGAQLLLCARDEVRLRATESMLYAGIKHFVKTCDVRDGAQVRAFLAEGLQRTGRLDGLVANAGVGLFRSVEESSDAEVAELLETNLGGVIRTVRESIPHLRTTKGGIVLVASAAGRRGYPGLAAYSATKGGLFPLADALRLELRGDGIGTTVVVPRTTRTPFFSASAGSPPSLPVDADAPERVVRAILRGLDRPGGVMDLSRLGRVKGACAQLFPTIYDRYLRRRLP